MTLMLPRLIDALEKRVKHSEILIMASDAAKRTFVDMATRAEKFDFGDIQFEPSEHADARAGEHSVPELTKVEEAAFWDGLIPLPADICWYEFVLNGFRSGMLVWLDADGSLRVWRSDYHNGMGVLIDLQSRLKREGEISVIGEQKWLKLLSGWDQEKIKPFSFAGDTSLAMYLTLMLYSKSTDIASEPAPAKLNKQRIARGDTPLPAHRVVTIVPGRYIDRTDGKGGTHASPRLHWRRSHLRHFDHQTAKAKWSATEVWQGQTGWFVTLIPRELVGKRELGEVSHEYVIRHTGESARP